MKREPLLKREVEKERLLATLQPFVYRRYLDYGALEGLRTMKAAIVAESLRPDVTVVSVARRHGIAKSVIYNWRANRREAEAIAREALEFIPCGQFVATSERASAC